MGGFAEVVSGDPEIREALINIEAWGLSARIDKTAVVVTGQNGMRLIELRDKAQILFFAREMGYVSGTDGVTEPACSTIARLESELAVERAMRIKITEERDAAQARCGEAKGRRGVVDGRYAKLRSFLARELHPDFGQGSDVERRVRTALFKVLWAKIEEIDKS